jgi:hypothetical protein
MRYLLILVLPSLFLLEGCASHLFFVEESHLGLKAKFRADSTAPFDVDLGYRRGVIALLPKQSDGGEKVENPLPGEITTPAPPSASSDSTETVLRVRHDPDDLMSLYSVFRANVGFADPVEVCHFMATGVAAIALLSNSESLKALEEVIGRCSPMNNP